MKHAIWIGALTCATIVVAAPKSAHAQTARPSIQAEALKDWTALKDTMVKIANEMPADKYSFKPTPAQQSFGERVVHIAGANNTFLGTIGGKAPAPKLDAKAAAMSKEAAVKAMEDSFDYGAALLKEQTDQTMMDGVMAPFLGSSSRTRVYSFLMGQVDIYGQLAVYLRLNGKVPPASQRP